MEKIAVFIDYSNVHLVGHGLFASGSDRWTTHVSPRRVAERIVTLRNGPTELSAVFVHRGSPDMIKDPDATRLFRAEQAKWNKDRIVHATYQPMVYGPHAHKEAGVDVRLGLDFVHAARSHEYDTIVLFSGDCDLFPAVQDAVRTTTRVELCAWSTGNRTPQNRLAPIASKSYRLWTHRLGEDDFWESQDDLSSAA